MDVPSRTSTPWRIVASLSLLAMSLCLAQSQGGFQCASAVNCQDDNGDIAVSVDQASLGLAGSDSHFYNGKFSIELKLPQGYSGGTLLAWYMVDSTSTSNKDPTRAEIDVEFYGGQNSSEISYTTNIFAGSKQNLCQMRLDFDPAADYHTYTIQWNSAFVAWYVDDSLYRIISRDSESPWPDRPMRAWVSTWDTSSFASLKADYSNGPVTSHVRNFIYNGCPTEDPNLLPGPGSCPLWRNASLPWMTPPSVDVARNTLDIRRRNLINEWGWSNA